MNSSSERCCDVFLNLVERLAFCRVDLGLRGRNLVYVASSLDESPNISSSVIGDTGRFSTCIGFLVGEGIFSNVYLYGKTVFLANLYKAELVVLNFIAF
jgi:hypothetical protein